MSIETRKGDKEVRNQVGERTHVVRKGDEIRDKEILDICVSIHIN